jgi:A/G-specific adenine glycosylase
MYEDFRQVVYDFYEKNRRDLPWRRTDDPYAILVSEVMLQQTQVPRVIEKYKAWIRRFPSALELSEATFADILPFWTGLGYNRRALYLKNCADEIVLRRRGIFPTTVETLKKLPGVGPYTASAICVFSYNLPIVLVETNVRTVMIHHFFQNQTKVDDKELLPFIEQTMDRNNPRRWFNALFDYGSYLKSQTINPSRRSKHYTKQSPLKGSVREVRGYIMKKIAQKEPFTLEQIVSEFDEERTKKAIDGLVHDKLLEEFWVKKT